MPGSLAYQLKNQLFVITIQELGRDALRNGESNEISDGEEGGVKHLNVHKQAYHSLSSSFHHLLCTLQLLYLFAVAMTTCLSAFPSLSRYEGKGAQGNDGVRVGKKEVWTITKLKGGGG